MNPDFDAVTISENDSNFAKSFEDFVNGKMSSAEKTAWVMACSHRYLQTQMFKVVLAYIRQLSMKWHKRQYDDRNEWAARLSSVIYDHLLDNGDICDFDYQEFIKAK